MAYKSTLLSSLIPIQYETTIDTLEDVERSGLPVLVPENAAPRWLMKTDPRPTVQRIWQNNRILYPFNGTTPSFVVARYAILTDFVHA